MKHWVFNMTYRIMCIRSASSIFGPACAYLKSNGKEQVWDDRTEAEAELTKLRRNYSHHIHYSIITSDEDRDPDT